MDTILILYNFEIMKKIRKNYSLEFKIQAVSLSEQRGNVSLVAQELEICKESLVNWRKLRREKANFLRSYKRRATEDSKGP